jgi:nucleoside-diphosphate-sugar epimerase
MRVFVTGATGWVGSAVVKDLLAAGHQVMGLARSDSGATALAAIGASVLRGSLSDLTALKKGAAESDGVIHTAMNHDFSKFAQNCAEDGHAIEALGEALAGSGRPLLVSSGLALIAEGALGTETDPPVADSESFPRVSEKTARALTARGVHATTVRLPPSVHGVGDHGFVPHLISVAREKGMSAYVGDGQNRWPAVHVNDAARVYRLALTHDTAEGPYHAVAEEGIPFRQIAEVIGRRLNLPVTSLSKDEATTHFGWFAMFAAMSVAATSERTRALLDWQPGQPGLIADIDQPAYFEKK